MHFTCTGSNIGEQVFSHFYPPKHQVDRLRSSPYYVQSIVSRIAANDMQTNIGKYTQTQRDRETILRDTICSINRTKSHQQCASNRINRNDCTEMHCIELTIRYRFSIHTQFTVKGLPMMARNLFHVCVCVWKLVGFCCLSFAATICCWCNPHLNKLTNQIQRAMCAKKESRKIKPLLLLFLLYFKLYISIERIKKSRMFPTHHQTNVASTFISIVFMRVYFCCFSLHPCLLGTKDARCA